MSDAADILLDVREGIARITLNRPDRLNSFTVAMHGALRDALDRVKADASARVLLLTGAGRGFCAGQDLSDRAVTPGSAPVDLGHSIETYYRPLVLTLRRDEVGELPPGILQDRPDSGFRRHVFPAAPRRHGARDGARDARRQALGRAGGAMGPHLEVRR
jgi:hypothetical protein